MKFKRCLTKKKPIAVMVNKVITQLHDRKGSSLYAIKKYILVMNTMLDRNKFPFMIKKYLRSAVTSGTIEQIGNKGTSSLFKLPLRKKKGKPSGNRVLSAGNNFKDSLLKKNTEKN